VDRQNGEVRTDNREWRMANWRTEDLCLNHNAIELDYSIAKFRQQQFEGNVKMHCPDSKGQTMLCEHIAVPAASFGLIMTF